MAYTPTTYSPTILKTEGTTTERGGNSKSATKVTLVDPNPGQEIVPHEDLFIYVNLKANTRPKSLLTQYPNKKYSISNLNGNTVSLSSPQESVSSNGLFKDKPNLTTDWTEIGGLKSVFGETGNDYEGFGITNIDINIKSQVSPTITIDFVDVRGATLFEQGSCSPYGFFFQLPYPVFELTVKGYYGKAATYYLNLVKFNTKFNSETGNMECRAEFIGYSFAFLSDIFMGYVMAASLLPNVYRFKDKLKEIYDKTDIFYEENVVGNDYDKTYFCDTPNGCITVLQLLKALNSFEKVDKQKIIDSPEYQELVQLKEVAKLYNEYRNSVEEFVKSYDPKLLQITGANSNAVKGRSLKVDYGNSTTGSQVVQIKTSTGGDLAIAFNTVNGTFLNSIKTILSTKTGASSYPYQLTNKAISCLCSSPNQFQNQSLTTYNIFDSSKIIDKPWYGPQDFWSLVQTAGSSVIYGYTLNSYGTSDQYFVDFGYILEDIYSEIEGLNTIIVDKQKEVNEQIDRIIEDRLKFKPTIRNVFTILLSNTEAFMEILKTVSIQAETYHSTESFGDFLKPDNDRKVEATVSQVFSWPTYSEQNINPPSEEQKFPGNNVLFQNWPEVIFVEDFLKAFLQLQKEIDLLNANYEGKPGYDNFAPINPLESPAWLSTTPNKYLDLVGSQDIFQVIGERLFIALDHSVFQPIRLTKDALLIGQGPDNGIGKGEWNPLKNKNSNFVKNIAELDSWNLLNSTTNEKQLQGLLATINNETSFVEEVKKILKPGLKELKGADIKKLLVVGNDAHGFKSQAEYYSYMTDKDKGISIKKDENDLDIWIHPNPFKMDSSNLIKIIKQEDIAGLRGINLTNEKFKTFLNDTYVKNLEASVQGIDFKTTAFNPKLTYSVIDPNQQLVSFDKPQLYTTLAMCYEGSTDTDIWWTNNVDVATQTENSKGGGIVSNMGMLTYWDNRIAPYPDGVAGIKLLKWDNSTLTGISPSTGSKTTVNIKPTTNTPLITSPMWLDNVIAFREKVKPGSNTGYTKERQNRNLAYLFLHTLKPTPFVQRIISDNGNLFYYENSDPKPPDNNPAYYDGGEAKPENYGPSLIWSHRAFNTIGGITKVPKAWLLTLGAQLWRWREFTGSEQGQKWIKPLICVDCTNKYDKLKGNDPLIQPGYDMSGANARTNENSISQPRNNVSSYLSTIYGEYPGVNYNNNTIPTVFGYNYQNKTDDRFEINNGLTNDKDYIAFAYFNFYKNQVGEVGVKLPDIPSSDVIINYSWPQVYIAPHHIPYVLPDKFKDNNNGEGADFVFITDDYIGRQDYQTIMPTTWNKQEYNEELDSTNLNIVGNTHRSKYEDGNLGMIFQYIPDGIKDEIVQIFEDWTSDGGEWENLLTIIDPVNFGGGNLMNSYSYRTGENSPVMMFTDVIPRENGVALTLNPNDSLLRLLTDKYWILNSTPKIWYGIGDEKINPTDSDPGKNNAFYEDGFVVSKDQFDTYLKSFYNTYNANLPIRIQELKDEKKDKSGNGSPIDDEDLKLSLYRSFKSLSEKWIQRNPDDGSLFFNVGGTGGLTCKNGASKKSTLASHFTYVNRVWGDIGDKSYIDITKINELKDNKKISLYQIITDILSDNEYLFFALPSYINLTGQGMGEEDLKDMFRPILDISDSSCGPLFVSMYVGGTSRKLDLTIGSTNCKIDNEAIGNVLNNVRDDGFSLTDINQPTDMASGNFTAFKVLYGVQNQNHFKNIQLDQSEFTETAESLNVIDKLAQNQGSDRTTKGQNLNSAYLTRSYTCTIESMGNMMIQPMTYFDLQGVPMFSGAYLITEVSHSVKPNNVSTTFKGVRQPRTIVPLVTSASIAMNLTFDENATGTGTGTSLGSVNRSTQLFNLDWKDQIKTNIPAKITSNDKDDKIVDIIRTNIEGGYYHPVHWYINDKGAKNNFNRFKRSGETMFGEDRTAGQTEGKDANSSGALFWKYIDEKSGYGNYGTLTTTKPDAGATYKTNYSRNHVTSEKVTTKYATYDPWSLTILADLSTIKGWTHNYIPSSDTKLSELSTNLAKDQLNLLFTNNFLNVRYSVGTQTERQDLINKIKSDGRLLFAWYRARYNGSGWFEAYAKNLIDVYTKNSNITNDDLLIADLDFRWKYAQTKDANSAELIGMDVLKIAEITGVKPPNKNVVAK